VKVPDTMAKPMSYWATQQRRIVADQLKDERIKRNNLSQAELMRGTARPKVKSSMPPAQQSNISKILLAARAENMPCPRMVAQWTDVTLPDDDGDVFYESSDGFNSDSTVSVSAKEDELMERIKRL
jgi:capsular polysaccharide biosynthesis protein